jgi:hypothetical protein
MSIYDRHTHEEFVMAVECGQRNSVVCTPHHHVILGILLDFSLTHRAPTPLEELP